MGMIGDIFGGGDDNAYSSMDAANTSNIWQKRALKYLKKKERLPNRLREGALLSMDDAYNGTGEEQQAIIDRARRSPLYGAIMGGQEAGEEAILRNAAATGGLRSGNVQENLYDYNTQLQNQALLQSYNQQMSGLQGLAGLPSLAPSIAQGLSNIGNTYAQGQIAQAQYGQQSQQNQFGNLMGLGSLGIDAYGAGMFSDRRLKKNIKLLGEHKGFRVYKWDWNIVANKMGLTGNTVGCLADEVHDVRPDAVTIKDLFMFVNYSKLGIFV